MSRYFAAHLAGLPVSLSRRADIREYAAQNLVVIGVNVDKGGDKAVQFLADTPADFTILYDPKGGPSTAYKVAGGA